MTWSVGRKIGVVFGAAVLALVVGGLGAYQSVESLIDAGNRVERGQQTIDSTDKLESLINEAQSGERGYMLTGDETYLEPYFRSVSALAGQLNDIRRLSEENPRLQRGLDSFERAFGQAMERTRQTIDVRKSKGLDASLADVRSGVGQKLADECITILHGIEGDEKEMQFKLDADSTATARGSLRNLMIGGLVMVAFLIGAGVMLTRSIARPLKTITDAAQSIAEGDISVAVPAADGSDEIGALARAFRQMVRTIQELAAATERIAAGDLTSVVKPQSERDVMAVSLAKMLERLQELAAATERIAAGDLTTGVKPQSDRDVMAVALAKMIENLRTTTKLTQEVAAALAAAATEILASVSQVAAGATETATAVNETATTVEEVKQTAHMATQRAKHVSDTAQKAVAVSRAGEKSVNQSIEGMDRIREQMEFIAESIVKLSEQSQAIGEIVSSVNDLAEQSNLLAVNASIEAARAGEHGKGFAVVAQEVKVLAEQSKQSTSQVRTILSDIQKATSGAVMAIEQGGKAVDVGVKQSTDTGESIQALARTVSEAAQAAIQIADSSQQQLIGVDQVTFAMENIKQASLLNVESMRQVEISAQNLNEMGQRLKTMIGQYRV